MVKVLFLLKRRPDFNPLIHTKIGLSTGLYNSANFMNEMLNESGIESALEVCIDNNNIDRYVSQYRPKIVIIEALWVVPPKFLVLSKLHKNVKWIIRLHSDMPFIASEGPAIEWITDYARHPNIIIAANSPRMLKEIRFLLSHAFNWSIEKIHEKVIYLPNYYPHHFKNKVLDLNKHHIDVSCFSAIRPLKNQLLQAFAALQLADSINKKLKFHINSGRIEMKGEPVLRNLQGLFQSLADKGHELISHEWRPREEFLELCGKMDVGMQVSFNETFNIVAADHISQGIPVVSSTEVPWAEPMFCANPVDSTDMYCKLKLTLAVPEVNLQLNKESLTKYTNKTKNIWIDYFKGV